MRWLLALLKAAGLLVALVAGLALAVFLFPGIVVRDATLPWAVGALRAYDLNLTWKRGHWSASSESFFRKRVTLSFEGLCYGSTAPQLRACVGALDTAFVFDLWKHELHIERLTVPSGEVAMESAPEPEKKDTAPVNPFEYVDTFQRAMSSFTWTSISVKNVSLTMTGPKPGEAIRLAVEADGESKPERNKLLAAVGGTLASGKSVTPLHASASLEMPRDRDIEYRFSGFYGVKAQRITFQTSGDLSTSRLAGRLKATLPPPSGEFGPIGVENCKYEWTLRDTNNHASLLCPLNAQLMGALSERTAAGRILNASRQTPLDALLSLEADIPGGDFQRTKGELRLESASLRSSASLDTKVTAQFDFDAKSDVPMKATADVDVLEFEKVAERLQETPWAVPAPLNQLSGKVKIVANATADRAFEAVHATFDASTDLASENQRLKLTAKGTVETTSMGKGPKTQLVADIEMEETSLSLPRLDPMQLPQLFPDSQIIYPREGVASSGAFTYKIQLKTKTPIRCLANQYDVVIPLNLDLSLVSGTGLTGRIDLPPFPVEFLRRKADVRGVTIDYPKHGAAELDAKVQFHYTDYDLTLSAFGKLDSPRYTLTSTPPLPENSAWALLLFGRPLEELTAGQGESLVSAQSAVATGAVSALSMYLLASTPVESIGYDPARGRFSATVKLVEGTSLRIEGQKEGVQSLGLRKRLGRDWVLNTTIEKESPTEPKRSVSTLLDWNHTY